MGNVCSISISLDDAVSRFSDCITGQANYICKLEKNFHDLSTAIKDLTALKTDVKTSVRLAEEQQLRPLEQVQHWISSVEDMEIEIDEVIRCGPQEIQKLYLGGCCSKNCKSSYKFGKKVAMKLEAVATLKSNGNFQVVAERVPSAPVDPRPCVPTVGMESMFDRVWSCLGDERVGKVGLFGLGGVGKTTLLTQINNQFLKTPIDFDFVIWVVVSKDLNLEKVQDDIWKKIGSLDESWKQKGRDDKAIEICKVLSKKKFVLLLDDIWEEVNLTEVGVPVPLPNNSKLVFTTRSKDVCGLLEAPKKIEVQCLPWEKAWELFRETVGDDTLNSHQDIRELAENVAKECGGLPLALITIGRAMACKDTREQWNHAIDTLRNSASKFAGMEDKVFARLKFSFDNLQNDTYRSCFSYCALFPEDHVIYKIDLIDHWIGEGFLGEYEELNRARNEGYDIIGTLLNACLLEEEEEGVKMHDVIRDMALWINCENGKEKKDDYFLVKAGARLREAPEVGKWEGAKRISLIKNEIGELTETPKCPNLTTLILSCDSGLKKITDGFFHHMPALQVLDLSNNRQLKQLPLGMSKLVSLQYLNFSYTKVTQLPIELKSLENLKYLNLDFTFSLCVIPRQLISSFSKLEVFKMFERSPYLEEAYLEDAGNELALVEELDGLKHLQDLGIAIGSASALQRYFRSNKLQRCTRDLHLMNNDDLSILNLSSLENMERLLISNFWKLKEWKIDWAWGGRDDIQATNDPTVSMIRSKKFFYNLRRVHIIRCSKFRNLTWLVFAPNINYLWLERCGEMEEVISVEKLGESPEEAANLNPFSKLKSLNLLYLPRLKSLYPSALPFPYLEEIDVLNCPELKRLPLNSSSAKGRKITIEGEKEWWDKLEWEDEATHNAFLPSFKAKMKWMQYHRGQLAAHKIFPSLKRK